MDPWDLRTLIRDMPPEWNWEDHSSTLRVTVAVPVSSCATVSATASRLDQLDGIGSSSLLANLPPATSTNTVTTARSLGDRVNRAARPERPFLSLRMARDSDLTMPLPMAYLP